MRLKLKEFDAWSRGFAFFPMRLNEEIIWLEWYWAENKGMYSKIYPGKERPKAGQAAAGEAFFVNF